MPMVSPDRAAIFLAARFAGLNSKGSFRPHHVDPRGKIQGLQGMYATAQNKHVMS